MTEKTILNYKGKQNSIRGLFDSDHIFKQINKTNNFYELNLLKKVESLNLTGVFIDVGANIGNHTIFFSENCNSSEVISIELDEKIFRTLNTNIAENNLQNKVKTINLGVGEKNKKVKISDIDKTNVGMTKIIGENGNIEIKKLDDIIQDKKNISLVKIDVEGYETNVLYGMEKILLESSPVIIAELRNDEEFNVFQKFINNFGYVTDRINYASTPTYFWYKNKKIDFLYIIPSFNRFDKLKNLLDSILLLKQNSKVIVLDDKSTDNRYLEFKNFSNRVTYLKNEINQGKDGFWKTINVLLNEMSKYDFNYGIMLGDDFKLNDDFEKKIKQYVNNNDIIRLFTQKNITNNWGYKNWVDGAICAPKKFFDDLNYKLEPINRNKMVSSGVGHQMTVRLNKLGYSVKNYGSFIEHIGNDDSKMHPNIRIKEPLISENFKNLSIIIPTYKNTKYLDECLNSIIESGREENIEIFVGVDGCEETLEYIKTKTYPDQIRFYYFKENLGPYIIKNSLTQITNSNNLLFFDSDDIMAKNTIKEVINGLKIYDCVKLKYNDYKNSSIIGKPNFGEGVFSIKKDLFINMNGFEPWKVAADSDFMGRLYKKKPRIYHTSTISFNRRIHSESLTQRKDTGMSSQLRAGYFKLSKNKKGDGNPDKLHTVYFEYVDVLSYEIPKDFKYENLVNKEKLNKVLNPTQRKLVDKKIVKSDPVVVDRLEILYKNRPEPVRTIKTNTPENRQQLIDQKNNMKNTLNSLFPKKTNPKDGKNMINFGGKLNR
jgi:FkbM family methyltransferase